MHFFGGRALVAWGDKVFYEVVGGDPTKDAAVRWVQLQVIDHFRYQRTATLLTPVFDGKERHCIWHRLLVDACIPSETGVEVWTRAEDDRQLLEWGARQPGVKLAVIGRTRYRERPKLRETSPLGGLEFGARPAVMPAEFGAHPQQRGQIQDVHPMPPHGQGLISKVPAIPAGKWPGTRHPNSVSSDVKVKISSLV